MFRKIRYSILAFIILAFIAGIGFRVIKHLQEEGKLKNPFAKHKKIPSGFALVDTNSLGYEEYRSEKDGSILIKIPSGEFLMGSFNHDNEKPAHKVYLDEYYIGKYEVANKK